MHKVELLKSWEEFIDKIKEPQYKGWAFRGQSSSKWRLLSKLGRYLNDYIAEEYWKDQEERIQRIFQRKAHLFLSQVPNSSDTFQWLALMQHHGAPTRLLDFTWSPYVAAFFALERTTTTAAVWAINPKNIAYISRSRFLANAPESFIGIGEPFVMNNRLIAQSGTFIATKQVTRPIEDITKEYNYPQNTLVKFELPADLVRHDGMRELFMMNITQATLFPDLDGLARSMAYELEFHWAYDPGKVLRK